MPRVRAFDALVLDGGFRSGLAVTRSLGRAGCRLAVEGPSRVLRSRYAAEHVALPDPRQGLEGFTSALLAWLRSHPADAVMTSSDWGVAALASARGELERLTAPAIASPEALTVATSKERTLAAAHEAGIRVPRALKVATAEEAVEAAAELGLPCVLKPDRSWRETAEGGGERVAARFLANGEAARREAKRLVQPGAPALVQEFVSGGNESIQLFRREGRITARSAVAASRTWPPLGGSYVMRVSMLPPEDSLRYAERLVSEIGLDGFSEVEFRRHADGRAVLMEVNPRFVLSLELPIRAGVDFARMQLEWARGGTPPEPGRYRTGVRLSWLGGELKLLAGSALGAYEPSEPPGAALRSFLRDYTPPPRIDGVELRDPRPSLRGIGATVAELANAAWSGGRPQRL